MDGARTIVATPVGTLLVWSNGADELLACTLSADDKASWTYRDVPGVAAVAETISVNRRPRTLRLRMATVERLQANAASATARHSGYAYQEEPRWSCGCWGMNWYGLEVPGASDAAKDKVRAVLLSFFAGWVDSEQGRALLHQAEDHRLTALIDRLDREAGELEQRAAVLRAAHRRAARLPHPPPPRGSPGVVLGPQRRGPALLHRRIRLALPGRQPSARRCRRYRPGRAHRAGGVAADQGDLPVRPRSGPRGGRHQAGRPAPRAGPQASARVVLLCRQRRHHRPGGMVLRLLGLGRPRPAGGAELRVRPRHPLTSGAW